MPVDPRILKSIADPTGGRLSDIGQIYAQGQQRKRETAREEELLGLKKDEVKAKAQQQTLDNLYKQQAEQRANEDQQAKLAELGSQAMGAYSTVILDAVENDPSLVADSTRFAQFQKETRDSFPEYYKEFIPEETQPVEEIQRGSKNAIAIQNQLNPTSPKTTFEMGSIQNIKTGEIQSRPKDDPYLAKMVGTNEWIKYSPSAGGTAADTDLTKKTKSKIQEEQLLTAEVQDEVAALDTMWNDFGKGKMDWLSQAGDQTIRVMEKLGLPITKGMEISSGQREKMKGRTKQLQTAWRLHVTGSQAGKWEIQDIASQPLNMDDTNSQWKVKLPAWKDKADRIAVRLKMAQAQGFTHSGTVKLSDDREMPMWTNEQTKETKAITDFGALGDIPSMDEYMDMELEENYPDPSTLSDKEKRRAISDVTNKARSLGYR